MIHPHTRIHFINNTVGYGIFATQRIPKGTLVYVKDFLDIDVHQKEFEEYDLNMQEQIEKYSYIDERGVSVLSWDLAKFVNHCCHSNTLSTGYGFDIAVKDINTGEELTCDYGTLNVTSEMHLTCEHTDCRKILKPSDLETHFTEWDIKLKSALSLFSNVDQPLMSLLDHTTLEELLAYFDNPKKYKSVLNLSIHQKTIMHS